MYLKNLNALYVDMQQNDAVVLWKKETRSKKVCTSILRV